MKLITPKQLLHLFARMPESLQHEVLEKTIECYYLLKGKNTEGLNRSKLYHKALLLVLNTYHKTLTIGSAKKHSHELDTLNEKSELQLRMLTKAKRRSARKGLKLLNQYEALIYRLKEKDGKSYSQISHYLSSFHKLKVDPTYLCKLYPQIKQKVEDTKAIAYQQNSIL